MTEWISLAVFVACYALFIVFSDRRSWVACGGALALVLLGALGWKDALFVKVSWNVMGLFFGTLILAELFMLSRVPAVMAEWLVDRAGTARSAMLFLCALSGAISMFVTIFSTHDQLGREFSPESGTFSERGQGFLEKNIMRTTTKQTPNEIALSATLNVGQ